MALASNSLQENIEAKIYHHKGCFLWTTFLLFITDFQFQGVLYISLPF